MGYYMQYYQHTERNYNGSSQKKDICNNKTISDFQHMLASDHMPANEQNMLAWYIYETEECILLEDQNMPFNDQNMPDKEQIPNKDQMSDKYQIPAMDNMPSKQQNIPELPSYETSQQLVAANNFRKGVG